MRSLNLKEIMSKSNMNQQGLNIATYGQAYDIEEKKKVFRKKSKQTDVSVQPTGKWIRRISQTESAISFSYVIK